MAFSWIICVHCHKKHLKDNRHINENIKLGHNFYCSKECFSRYKNKQIELACKNAGCKKAFRRIPAEISENNFCSHSCSAIFNNSIRYRVKKQKNKLTVHKRIALRSKGSSLGGRNRWLNYKSVYTREYIIDAIRRFAHDYNRIPLKRELNKFYRPARLLFGTWNNAIIAAGFKPNPVLFAEHQLAQDGHSCDSIAEKLIDDWLYQRNIPHKIHIPYLDTKFTSDFLINDIYIEFFGLAGELKRYDNHMKEKLNIIKRNKLKLIAIYPKDLLPKARLDNILSVLDKY